MTNANGVNVEANQVALGHGAIFDFERLDFSGLSVDDSAAVRAAIARRENFYGYIPSAGLGFIIRNYRSLAAWGVLEEAWLDAYVHASHFDGHGLATIMAVFDACDRQRLHALRPVCQGLVRQRRYSLFRGCAGPLHTPGLSWTSSLDKAIWYAAKHASYNDLADCAVYAATVSAEEIYCRLDHYDDEFIAYVPNVWRIDVPQTEFRLDRPR